MPCIHQAATADALPVLVLSWLIPEPHRICWALGKRELLTPFLICVFISVTLNKAGKEFLGCYTTSRRERATRRPGLC